VHSIQIWIETAQEDLPPSYQQIAFPPSEKRGRFHLLAGPDRGSGELTTTINQDASIYVSELAPGETLEQSVSTDRYAWIQVLRGGVSINGTGLKEGDGAAVSSESKLSFVNNGSQSSEFLLFDLP
jgi:redox-sensitive bicupin YhaK (pirin superfamily)